MDRPLAHPLRALATLDAFDVLRSLIVAGCALALILAGADFGL